MIMFYAPDIETTGKLPESDSAHCCRVLRMKEGDDITVTDGKGHRFQCRIVEAHPNPQDKFAGFVLWVGNKRLIKRRLFDLFIEQAYSI